MKVVVIEETIPVDIDNIKNILFGDGRFLTVYHDARKDFDLVVGAWQPNNDGPGQKRVVTFQAPFQAPAVVSKFFKSNVTTCTVEEVMFFDDQKRLIVTNDSKLGGIPMAESFRTFAIWTFETTQNAESESVETELRIEVQVEFSGRIFGVSGAVESAMKSDAEPSFRQWADMAKSYCVERMTHELKNATQTEVSTTSSSHQHNQPLIPSLQLSQTTTDTNTTHDNADDVGPMSPPRPPSSSTGKRHVMSPRGYFSDSGSEFDSFYDTKSDLEGYPQDDEHSEGESESSHHHHSHHSSGSSRYKTASSSGSVAGSTPINPRSGSSFLISDILVHNRALLALRDELTLIKNVAAQTDSRARALERTVCAEGGTDLSVHQCLRRLEDIYNRSVKLTEETRAFEEDCRRRIDAIPHVEPHENDASRKSDKKNLGGWIIFGLVAGTVVLGVPVVLQAVLPAAAADLVSGLFVFGKHSARS